MPNLPRPIVVYAPTFDETSGGIIVLHYLVDRLRSIGREAYVFPARSNRRIFPTETGPLLARAKNAVWNEVLTEKAIRTYSTHPSMDVSIAPRSVVRDAIVVYPEIVSGNPLKSKHVVRWLLHKPGYHFSDVSFGENELTFFYQEAFCEGIEGIDPGNLLRVRWLRDDVYFDRASKKRQGACRMIRKGTDTKYADVQGLKDAILVDGMSHEETADVFNTTATFYCHDLYTLYAYYAALCGCTPVIVPRPGLSSEEWRASFELKHGVAYGVDEIEWANETRDQLLADLAASKTKELKDVADFAAKLELHFE